MQSLEQPVRRLSGFIYDLLALAKLEREKPNIYAGLNLSELIGEIAEELEIIAENKGIQIKSSIKPQVLITGDGKRLREAFLNIASNALTYMRDEGTRRIAFTLTQEDETAHLSIADTGRGIPSSELPRVFERFYRGSATKDTTRGNGLGLSLARRIVEQHSGTIKIESIEGTGTTVHIFLPLEP
jgi:two-component system phosphate regulon sensor histidine kinase PhoR